MAETIALHRWIAIINYRHDDGIKPRIVGLHELADLHDIVEAGPNFYTIDSIQVGPAQHHKPLTVEQAEQL
jgi:hypothetical protein